MARYFAAKGGFDPGARFSAKFMDTGSGAFK